MSLFVILVALAVVVPSQTHPISQEDKGKLFLYHKECVGKTGVEENTVIESHEEGSIPGDPKLKEYFFCLAKKIGVLNEEGSLQIDLIRKKLGKYLTDVMEIDRIIVTCAVQKETPVESAVNFFKCCRENVKNHVDVFFYIIPVTEEKQEKLKKYCNECAEETNVNIKFVEAARRGEFSDDPVFKKYVFCMSKKLGIQKENGSIQRDILKEKLTQALKDSSRAEKLFDSCVIEKDVPEETAFVTLKCFFQKVHLNFLGSITLPSGKVKKLKAYHTACLNQTSANTSLIEAAGKGEFVEDSRLKEYFLCLSKKIQFQNEDGEIQKNVLRQKMTEVFRDPLVTQQLIEKCAVKQDSPQNTAFNTLKCYYENTPNHVNIFQVTVLNDEQKERLTRFNSECQLDSEIDSEKLEQIKKGQFSNDDKFKNHLFCFYRKLGLQDSAGNIQKEVLSDKIGKLLADPALSEKLLEKCAIRRENPEDTAFEAFSCYFENTPSHFNIFSLF